MRYIKHLGLLMLSIFALVGCNDQFLDTEPKDALTAETKWSAAFLDLYCNGFYSKVIGHDNGWGQKGYLYVDDNSDNQASFKFNRRSAGLEIVPETGGGWGKVEDWDQVKRANFLLAGIQNSTVTDIEKKHYAGLARFWRAWFYFKKVKKFGDVTWFTKVLEPTDKDILYGPRTARNDVMDSVLVDINYACENIQWGDIKKNDHINKGTALAIKARICLHEGTYRKYHSIGEYEVFLHAARDAAKELIDANRFSLYTEGGPEHCYNNLFKLKEMEGVNELILVRRYLTGIFGHARIRYRGGKHGLTKDLVNDYLNLDGTFYDGSRDDNLPEELSNRDPRLVQTIWFKPNGGAFAPKGSGIPLEMIPAPSLFGAKYMHPVKNKLVGVGAWNSTITGYHISLSYDQTELSNGDMGGMDAPVIRYAEVLLIYAEAMAELGECSQAVLDMTINTLRERVGMAAKLTVDPVQEPVATSDRGMLDYTLPPLLEEIRRERRVELAAQGFRRDDLMRWDAGKFLVKPMRGMRLRGYNLEHYMTKGVKVKVDDEGYIDPYKEIEGYSRQFIAPKDYLFPIPYQSLVENPALKQNQGWPDVKGK
ncbi:RagB/SusD family nutrient uptake outer membrane protein [Prolixibacteraceae bacterium]|nr:RagB/SusD family nutrient uptake outer membrane protein [Prolixibacteraceae bacterium]